MLQKKFQKISDLLYVFNLFFLSNLSAFFYIAWLTPEFVYIETILWLLLAPISVWFLFKNNLLYKFLEISRRNWFIFPFLIYSGLSIFWSVYWEISLSRWLIFLITIIAGAYIGLRYDIREIVILLSVFGVFILLLSSLVVFFWPLVGVMNYHSIQGAWKGLYWHKGHMGMIAAFINILFLINIVYILQFKGKHLFFWGLQYLFSFLFVYKTDSVGAYLSIIFLHGVILLALLYMKFKRKISRLHYLFFFIGIIAASIVLYFNISQFFSIFNRNTSLTGRIPMWTYLYNAYISKQPYSGYGFNAFWYIDSHRVAVGQAAGYPDPVVIADNGFIDILINTGYVGIILFFILYFGAWWKSIKFAASARDISGIFPVILMFYTLIANISWSLIFESESFFMLIMIAVLFSISVKTPLIHDGAASA